MPGSLVVINVRQRTLDLPLLIVGREADRFVAAIREQSGDQSVPRIVSFASPDQPTWSFLPVRLGEVRGWTPVLYVYAISDEPALIPTLERHGKDCRGFVVAGELSGASLTTVAGLLSTTRAVFAVYGSFSVAKELGRLVGTGPVVALEPHTVNALEVLKPVVRSLLNDVFAGA